MTSPAATTAALRPLAAERYHLRRPQAADGKAVHALIAACAPLDTNSLYLNLLQCTHFAETCVLAERTEQPASLAGFVSGYLLPNRPTVLFIWQVAIAAPERGYGLARALLFSLLERPGCLGVDRIETTITESNGASWALFRSLARSLDCPFEDRVLFDRNAHLDGVHESEVLVTIGPFEPRNASTNRSRRTSK